MDIIAKYANIIALYCDNTDLLEYLKDNGGITLSTYWVMKYSYEQEETYLQDNIVDMILNHKNTKAAGYLFQYMAIKHPQLIMMIPELSTGERYSLHLGSGQFVKILNGYTLPFIRFVTIKVI